MSNLTSRLSQNLSWVKKHPLLFIIFACLFLGLILIVLWATNPSHSPTWTGFGSFQDPGGNWEREKTLWDWMNLLIVPMALAVGAYILNRAERASEQQIARDRMLESALQDYLDKMTELLLKENLRDSQNDDEARSIARSRTLTALRILDNSRKGVLLRFLHESGLISQKPVIKLKGADLTDIDLKKANLSDANISRSTITSGNLEQARLIEADFSYCRIEKALFVRSSLLGANLTLTKGDGANFTRSTLANANFDSSSLKKASFVSAHGIKANFQSAQLQQANFSNANLKEANFNRANLENANLENANLTNANLCGVNLKNANLKGTILDGANLSFANLEKAKVKPSQLEKVSSLSVTIMMSGKLYQGEKYVNTTHGR